MQEAHTNSGAEQQPPQLNKKTFNGYLAADVLAVAIFILLFSKKISIIYSSAVNYLLAGMAITWIFILMQAKLGKAQVTNKSNGDIYVKNEADGSTHTVPPASSLANIDGVKIGATVYKVPDGVHAVVTKAGKLRVWSLFGAMVYRAGGGVLAAPPDDDWKGLFSKGEAV